MDLYENERIDDLQRKLPDGTGLRIIQNKNWFCFGIDAVLLADFADVRKGNKVMDLGTGNGIIPLLMTAKTDASNIDGLEIQSDVAEMAKRSISLNNLGEKINIISGDIVGYRSSKQYDVVVCNPPYKSADTGLTNPNEKLRIARHEVKCNLTDIITTASKLLKPYGRFSLIHRPERLVDVICNMRELNVEPKRIRYIHSYAGEQPVMVMVEGQKCAKPYIKTEPPLVIYNRDGSYTDEVNEIYNG